MYALLVPVLTSFIRNSIQFKTSKLAQDRGLIQRFFHGRVTVTKPVLQQMHSQHSHRGRAGAAAFSTRIMWFNQSDQSLPRYDLLHLFQEKFLAGLLAFVRVLSVCKGYLFQWWALKVEIPVFCQINHRSGLFQSFPKGITDRKITLHQRCIQE